jgi:hypothetical protein
MALNEKKWWSSYVKPAWTSLNKGRLANKVQDAYNGGLPDVDFCFNGVAGKVELKYAPAWPKYDTTTLTFSKDKVTNRYCLVSPTQLNQLSMWHNCGGIALVLIGVAKEWFLFNVETITEYNQTGMTRPVMHATTLISGVSYHDLHKVPDFLEERYGRR